MTNQLHLFVLIYASLLSLAFIVLFLYSFMITYQLNFYKEFNEIQSGVITTQNDTLEEMLEKCYDN